MTSKEREYFLNAGFTKEQTDEIDEGKKAGLNTAIYANKKYLPIQMRQIRLGLLERVPVEYYAKPEYDWFQMEEIRLGLKSGVDVGIYDSPQIPFDKMRQIRKGLEKGFNLYSYISLDACVLRQLRKARVNGVNILKYINEGYDAEQLQEIRIALEMGINMDAYLTKEYRAASIAQIRKGLERGVDVSLYANITYSWRQMREIRKGLENQIDVNKYINPFYSWGQMREIRLGLVEGLNVESYSSLRYPYGEMRKKRMGILNAIREEEERKLQAQVKSEDFTFSFMSNGMEAYVTLNENKVITKKRLLQILELNGIRRGIIDKALEEIVKGRGYRKTILVAQGQIPRKGEDGEYEFFFRTNPERKPKILKDGTADYRHIEWFEMVKAGQKLAVYHEAKEGIDGYDVSGNPVKGRKGIEKRILTGQGFHLEADKKTYVADIDGMIRIDDYKMNISNHMLLEEVNLNTGNIRFDGSVHVLGDVGYGAVIRATDDVVIDGTVENATIESGGSVVLKKGMNSAGHGLISAKKDVVSRFFESVKVLAKGNIDVGKSLNSQLYADGMIISNGTIAGGTARACKGFKVKHVGNQAGIRTTLHVKVDDSIWEERRTIKLAISDVKAELEMLTKSYEEFKEKFPPEERNNMDMFKKVENSVFAKTRQLEQLEAIEGEIENSISKIREARVIIQGRANEGTTVELDGCRWVADNEYNVVVKKQDGGLAVSTM